MKLINKTEAINDETLQDYVDYYELTGKTEYTCPLGDIKLIEHDAGTVTVYFTRKNYGRLDQYRVVYNNALNRNTGAYKHGFSI